MKTLGNIIWVLFGGFLIFLEYISAGIGLCITIVGIPFGIQSFKLAILALCPFGYNAEDRAQQTTGCLNTFMNILWIIIGGIWICLTHLIFGTILCLTIIGIPFGKQHFKLARLSLTPFGKDIKKI